MTSRQVSILIVCCALLPCFAASREVDETPQEIGLVESTKTRLAQLDMTVIGPADVLEQLTEEDFTIRVNLTKIKEFQLDRVCTAVEPLPPRNRRKKTNEQEALPASPPPQANYLFYFDQPHLTQAGRFRSLELAQEMVRDLIGGDSRGMILSNAAKMAIIEPLTSDPEKLIAALKRLENDREQWDTFADEEERRVQEVAEALGEDLQHAIAMARMHQKEERWRTDRNMRRLKIALGQLNGLDPPKAVIYFADRIRSNPGDHYLSFFGARLRTASMTLEGMLAGTLPFDDVVDEASAQGIRIYTVQAEGLVAHLEEGLASHSAVIASGAVPQSMRLRTSSAQSALRDLASETGGHAFLNGVAAHRISHRVRSDSSCLFLISFDPSGFREDAPMRIVVKTAREDIEVRVRGRMVFQSESARRTSKLLLAFSTPGELPSAFEVHASLVPTGFDDGRYSALLQLSVPGIPIQSATWDLGASVVNGDKVGEEVSGRLALDAPGIPAILERELTFKPGTYEIVTVAHETSSGLVASHRTGVDWPDPKRNAATVGPIALIQSADGAFSRSGDLRRSGFLSVGPESRVRGELPTALVCVVCRSKRKADGLQVERKLIGETEVEFPEMSFDSSDDRCAQTRDLIAPGTLGPGHYIYRVRVLDGERVVDEGLHEFDVAGD